MCVIKDEVTDCVQIELEVIAICHTDEGDYEVSSPRPTNPKLSPQLSRLSNMNLFSKRPIGKTRNKVKVNSKTKNLRSWSRGRRESSRCARATRREK